MRYRRLSIRYAQVVREWPLPDPFLARLLPLGSPQWRPAADLYEGRDGLVLEVELAGVSEDDIEVAVYEDAVVLEGARRADAAAASTYHAAEIRRGPFRLAVALPRAIDRERVSALLDRGMLRVTLPLAEGR